MDALVNITSFFKLCTFKLNLIDFNKVFMDASLDFSQNYISDMKFTILNDQDMSKYQHQLICH